MFNLREFEPAHGFLVELILEQRQALADFRDLLYRERSAAKGFLQLALLFFERGDVVFQLFELTLLLIGKLPFGFLTVFSFWGFLDGCGLLCLLGCRIRLRLQGTPLTILGIVAREIPDLAIPDRW